MLTEQQAALLAYIDRFSRERGICPSFNEMRNALDLRSKGAIHRLILALEERGFIRRLPSRARSIEVLRKPALCTISIRHDGHEVVLGPGMLPADFKVVRERLGMALHEVGLAERQAGRAGC